MSNYYSQKDSGVFVQFYPGGPVYYLGNCVDLDSIPNPRWGGKETRQCWNNRRDGYTVIGKTFSPPGTLEYTISEIRQKAASWLEEMTSNGCPFILYALQRKDGDRGLWNGWERASIVADNDILGNEFQNVAHHEEDESQMVEYSLGASPPRYDVRQINYTKQVTAAVQAINSISPCGDVSCGVYSGYNARCNRWYAAVNAVASNVLYSDDEGVTWTATSADPYADEVMAVRCFPISTTVNRILAFRATQAGAAFQVSYSDNGGVSWIAVSIGSTNAEALGGEHGVFGLDWQHIWVATTLGNIFFSADGGATWTEQGTPIATQLNAINFVDENVGYAVGNTDVILYTVDGGTHWTSGTATGTGDNLLDVKVWSQYHVMVGTNDLTGLSLLVSFDGTATWEQIPFTGKSLESVDSISFVNDFVGIIVTNTVAPVGSVHLTINGGRNWEELSVPTNSGLEAVAGCAMDSFIVVGAPNGGTGVIISYG